jgi:predicted NUDIX family phosphoesterase
MAAVEEVFVVARRDFFGGDWPQGFLEQGAHTAGMLDEFVQRGFFVGRPEAEQNPEWKQLIPYCVLRRPAQVFCVQRKQAQTEVRLHNLLSIGIGGHINPRPAALTGSHSFFAAALLQELEEELAFVTAAATADGEVRDVPKPAFCGLLNDDATEVGRVHCGLVYALDFPSPAPGVPIVRVREVSKMAGGFRHLAELDNLWQDPARFESWSRILFQAGLAGPNAVSRALRTRSAQTEGVERNENG